MNLADAVRSRRSVRAFTQEPVPRAVLERAIGLAVQAPAPHHSQPWRFAVLEDPASKRSLAHAMGSAWRSDLVADGMAEEDIERITRRSHELLTGTPALVVCCADTARAHSYGDGRRRLAEWSLFAHSVGAALQTFMLSLAADGVASCWLSAPVFCRDVVRRVLDLPEHVEPHALVLVGYASPNYEPRPRPEPNPAEFTIPTVSLEP
ncbi:MAG: nitroreductase family protein [Actinomycetota bacterium]